MTKNYSNKDITVVWQPDLCIHSKNCWNGLLSVFNPKEIPWIKMDGASTEQIIEQVGRCPSGALSYHLVAQIEALQNTSTQIETLIEVSKNGPLLVYGNITVKHKDGSTIQKQKVTALCRCGGSSNKPFCDGTHLKIGFKDE